MEKDKKSRELINRLISQCLDKRLKIKDAIRLTKCLWSTPDMFPSRKDWNRYRKMVVQRAFANITKGIGFIIFLIGWSDCAKNYLTLYISFGISLMVFLHLKYVNK